MTSVILNSNENSAIISTIVASDSKEVPSIYSTKKIYAPSATSWFSLNASNGSRTNGQSENWQLPKFGVLTQILFNYEKTLPLQPSAVAPTGGTIPFVGMGVFKADVFDVIDRVEFLSSSRVISTLYSEDLRSQFSNLSQDQINPMIATALQGEDASTGQTVNQPLTKLQFTIPLCFGMFRDINTCPNLQFNENCAIRVVYNNVERMELGLSGNGTLGTVVPPTISSSRLHLRYKQYSESDTAELLAENYSAETLNQLTSRFYRENPVVPPTNRKDNTASVELRNIDAVKAFYISVKKIPEARAESDPATNVARAVNNVANEYRFIKSVKLTSSGQVICELDAQQLRYSKFTENGWSFSQLQASSEFPSISNVVKIQTGLWENAGGGAMSNAWSLREMNNCVIEVEWETSAGVASSQTEPVIVNVEEECLTILSTSSNTGRVVNSLSN